MNSKALGLILAPVAAVGSLLLGLPGSHLAHFGPAPRVLPSAASSTAPGAPVAAPATHSLAEALEQRLVGASFSGNGRERLTATLSNASASLLRVRIDAGQVFTSGRNVVLVAQERCVDLAPHQSAKLALLTVAIRSSNKVLDATYLPDSSPAPQLLPLLGYFQIHPEISPASLQTAALALLENLPLSAVARFASASGGLRSRFNTDAFRVEPLEILGALSMLRAMGLPDEALAMTVDPQLRIEAMIDPASRPAAMRYYSISSESEWDFWKNELLNGAPATRHYALYGIARFFPDVALDMLPNWAREPQTSAVYRMAAVQALADTRRPETLPILRQLSEDLGAESELGRAAAGAAACLAQRLSQNTPPTAVATFRATVVNPGL